MVFLLLGMLSPGMLSSRDAQLQGCLALEVFSSRDARLPGRHRAAPALLQCLRRAGQGAAAVGTVFLAATLGNLLA